VGFTCLLQSNTVSAIEAALDVFVPVVDVEVKCWTWGRPKVLRVVMSYIYRFGADVGSRVRLSGLEEGVEVSKRAAPLSLFR
jgi:hypothetical protein